MHKKIIRIFFPQAKDYMCAYSACSQLMRTGYAPAWSVCMDLAEKGNCVLGTRFETMCFIHYSFMLKKYLILIV